MLPVRGSDGMEISEGKWKRLGEEPAALPLRPSPKIKSLGTNPGLHIQKEAADRLLCSYVQVDDVMTCETDHTRDTSDHLARSVYVWRDCASSVVPEH